MVYVFSAWVDSQDSVARKRRSRKSSGSGWLETLGGLVAGADSGWLISDAMRKPGAAAGCSVAAVCITASGLGPAISVALLLTG